jgi:hypothetical protein
MQNNIVQNTLDELGVGFIYPLNEQSQNQDFKLSRGGWRNTRWIVLSSSFFSLPAISIFAKNSMIGEPAKTDANYFAKLLIVTSLVSANYWRDSKRGWRRNSDLILAKITFSTGVYYGIIYATTWPYIIVLFFSIASSLYLYGKSAKLIDKNDQNWVKYHFAFHICLAIGASSITEQMIIDVGTTQ